MNDWRGVLPINQSNKKIDTNPYQDDIQNYLCEGYSPEEVCRWLHTKTEDPKELLSVSTIRRIKNKNCPHVKTDRTKKLVNVEKNNKKKPSKIHKETVQTEYIIKEDHDATPEETVQKLLNIIFYNCHKFKDGNVVQALSAVARLINDKEIEKVDVEDTMRRFVSNDKLMEKIQNAKYD